MSERAEGAVCCRTDEGLMARIAEVVEKYRGTEGCLIQVLHEAQQICGYLPADVQKFIAKELKLTRSTVSGVISFYSFFSTEPRAKHTVRVCMGTACYVRGGDKILQELKDVLGVNAGVNTHDNKFRIEITRCLGACGLAPVITVDGDVYGRLSPDMIPGILAKYE